MFLQNFAPFLKKSAPAGRKKEPYEVMHVEQKIKGYYTWKCEAVMHDWPALVKILRYMIINI